MRTPSHFIITAALRRSLPNQNIATQGFLLGSIAPDLPLYLLSISRAVYLYWVEGRRITSFESFVFEELYFSNPLWIASHNFFHAPLILGFLLFVTWRYRFLAGIRWQVFWFASGAMLHSVIDILTHFADGPVLFFPLNWSYRFQSPVSYCDPAHYGLWFTGFEYLLDGVLLVFLIPSVRTWFNKRKGTGLFSLG